MDKPEINADCMTLTEVERSIVDHAHAEEGWNVLADAGFRRVFEVRDQNADARPQWRDGKERLVPHLDARGGLVELWREDWEQRVDHVAQAYISITSPGVVKAWHAHRLQTDRLVCIRGRVLVVTYDLLAEEGEVAPTSPTERVLDGHVFERIDIPPLTAHGWMALGAEEAWVLNLTSHPYDGTDEYRRGAHDGPIRGVTHDWRRNRDG